MPYFLRASELHIVSWLNPFSKAFLKIYYFPKIIYHILGPSKVTGWSIFNYFNKVSLEHLLNQKCYRLFFKASLKIPKLLPGSQKDIFVTLLKSIRRFLFSTIMNWVISVRPKLKSDLTILYLKALTLVNVKFFQVQVLWKWLRRHIRKTGCFQDIPVLKKISLLKKQLFGISTCFKEVHVLNNYFCRRKTSSETVPLLKKYLSLRSSLLEKILLPKSTNKKEVAAEDNRYSEKKKNLFAKK